jgi:hypothetical protein
VSLLQKRLFDQTNPKEKISRGGGNGKSRAGGGEFNFYLFYDSQVALEKELNLNQKYPNIFFQPKILFLFLRNCSTEILILAQDNFYRIPL